MLWAVIKLPTITVAKKKLNTQSLSVIFHKI